MLAVMNDLCYVNTDSLGLRSWLANDYEAATSEIGICDALASLRDEPVAEFVSALANRLSSYDWRTFSAPGLTQTEKSMKARFRGSTGYRELRADVLRHLADGDDDVANSAERVLTLLNW